MVGGGGRAGSGGDTDSETVVLTAVMPAVVGPIITTVMTTMAIPVTTPATSPAADPATNEDPADRKRLVPSFEFNAIALMASTGITAIVGLLFWAIAARLPAEEVGRASAVISTAAMLCNLSSSNIGLLFGRVLGSAGKKSWKVVLAGYAIAATLGGVLGTAFVLFFPSDELFATSQDRVFFPFIVILFCIFVLQDWVLTGLRASGWIPLEQLLFSIAKLGLLLLFIALSVHNGIVVAWAIPVLIAVLVVNPILFGRVLPRRPPPSAGAPPMPDRPALVKIFLAEYATGAVTVVIPLVLPLMVISMLGAEANAYYALPWLIGESLSLLMWNVSSSYMVESSHDTREQAALMGRSFRLSFLIAGLGVPFLLIAAPWLLSFLGSSYADQGSSVLRLLACAIPFTIITMMFINTSRVRNQMGRVVAVEALIAVVTIVLAVILIRELGVTGAALAYLIAQMVTVAIVIIPLAKFIRANKVPLLRKPASDESLTAGSAHRGEGGPRT